jgi:hypothetical protein
MEHWWNDNWQVKSELLREETVPVPVCPTQIPCGLHRDGTQSSAVRGQEQTAWARTWHDLYITQAFYVLNICSLLFWLSLSSLSIDQCYSIPSVRLNISRTGLPHFVIWYIISLTVLFHQEKLKWNVETSFWHLQKWWSALMTHNYHY